MLKQKSEVSEVNLKAAVDSLVKDKQAMRQILKDADQEYKLIRN